MFSFFTKEASYGAAVTVNGTNFLTLKGAKIKVEWPDDVADDSDMVTGTEFGTSQEILQAQVRITITEERSHSSFVAGARALTLGSNTPAQDGAETAYRHKGVLMANSASLPSINGIVVLGGNQLLYKGLVAQSYKENAAKGGYLTTELVLVGNGTRVANADSFPAWVDEAWLKARNLRCWLETGANISLDAAPTQGAESISSATPDALSTRFRSYEFSVDNKTEFQLDNLGVDIDRRDASFKIEMDYSDATEIGYYTAQDNCAVEVDLDSGSLVDPQGAFKFGCRTRIPRCRIKSAPIPDGGETGRLGSSLDFKILDDATNPVVETFTYIAAAALLA
jgi:hypothetical protein